MTNKQPLPKANPNTPNSGELKAAVVDILKKTYFNARTDVIGEQNGNLPNGSKHALTVIEFQADDVLALFKAQTLCEDLLKIVGEDDVPEHVEIKSFDDVKKQAPRLAVNEFKAELRTAIRGYFGVES